MFNSRYDHVWCTGVRFFIGSPPLIQCQKELHQSMEFLPYKYIHKLSLKNCAETMELKNVYSPCHMEGKTVYIYSDQAISGVGAIWGKSWTAASISLKLHTCVSVSACASVCTCVWERACVRETGMSSHHCESCNATSIYTISPANTSTKTITSTRWACQHWRKLYVITFLNAILRYITSTSVAHQESPIVRDWVDVILIDWIVFTINFLFFATVLRLENENLHFLKKIFIFQGCKKWRFFL